MLRQCIFILSLLIGYYLNGQGISWEVSVGAGITNLNDLSSPMPAEAGPVYQIGLLASHLPQKHGFTAFAGLGGSRAAFTLERGGSGSVGGGAIHYLADTKLYELCGRLGAGYTHGRISLLAVLELPYTVAATYRGFVEGGTPEPPDIAQRFEVSYGNSDEHAFGRVAVQDDRRLYTEVRLLLRTRATGRLSVGLGFKTTASNADFQFLGAEPCGNGQCPELVPLPYAEGGFGTKQRTTAFLTTYLRL